jgi:hypothetical protein
MRVLHVLLFTVAVNLTACAEFQRDRRDAPHDPNFRTGATMFDQIPNWEGAANKTCCGHLRKCEAYQSPRC